MKFFLFLVLLTSISTAIGSASSQAQNLHECDGTFSSSLEHIEAVDINCQAGELLVDDRITIEVPDLGQSLSVRWILDGTLSGIEDSVLVSHFGPEVLVSNFDETGAPQAPLSLSNISGLGSYPVNSTDTGCQNDSHSSDLYRFPTGVSWYYNSIGEPASLSLTRIGNGFTTWKNETNRCGIAPKGNNLVTTYRGTTTSPEAMGGNPPPDQIALCSSTREIDGLNVIGWGHLPAGVVAATCLTTIPGGVKESDIRFSTDYNWFTQYSSTGCSNAWDLGDIATHEIGHMIGLGHSVAGTDQVMNPYAYSCNYANRKLAKGDLLSLSHFYGGN
ncbi:MAG: matrixin family metalloprotease [Actinomycetes bacterium]